MTMLEMDQTVISAPLSSTRTVPQFDVQFLLSTNLPSSVTRITADTASVLARLGIRTQVLFPAVDWWDYKLFCLSNARGPVRWKQMVALAGELVVQVPWRRRWCGLAHHPVHPSVGTQRYVITPSARTWHEQTVTVVHPPYLVPHLLRTLQRPGIPIVSAVHVNLEKAMRSSSPEAAMWYRNWVARERFLSIPRYAVSEEAKEAAERLGIPVRKVIHNGTDLSLFQPPALRLANRPLVVTLYCDPNLQKGQAVGAAAFQTLPPMDSPVRLCSLGRVSREHAGLFDDQYGFLHGKEYVKALQETDIFVYPSWYDGFPAPPLEAMACGAAVVTTAVEGVREYAVHEENALVCEPGNVEMMRDQVVRLLRDRPLRERLQLNGPGTAKAFSVERSALQLLEFLREVYEEQPRDVATMVAV